MTVSMAVRITDERANELRASRRSANRLYPWETWSDGQWWQLTQGDDYQNTPRSFAAIVYKYASRNGLRATIAQWEHGVLLRLTPATTPAAPGAGR